MLVDEEFQVFLNFSANFGMLSENLRRQLASNHQHLKQLQDSIRSSISSRPDAASFSDAVDHFDSFSIRGSECSSVTGRRTPTQVIRDRRRFIYAARSLGMLTHQAAGVAA